MTKYHVTICFDASVSIEVEANSPEEAIEAAYIDEASSVGLCHQCSRDVELGDPIREIVYDAECSNELLDTGHEAMRIDELESQVKRLQEELENHAHHRTSP